ncbi:MAG: amidohydrolase family protein [Ornithinimicrobium sp.]
MSGQVGLVDHHCHTVVARDLDRPRFEALMTEAAHPAAAGTSYFDSPLGLAIRRWCAPILDVEPGIDADGYLERRAALGADAANRRLMRAAGLDALLVDTGLAPKDSASLTDLAQMAGAPVHEVVRIERVAEEVLQAITSPTEFTDAFEARLRERAARAVGLKSVVAYRGGLALAPSPDRRQVESAVEQILRWSGSAVRLEDPSLLRHGLDVAGGIAAEQGLPVQFHTGFGDPNLQLDQANPALLTPLLREWGQRGVTVTMLHCYPYHREAGYLASVFPHVYLDVGLAISHLGASSDRVLAESLELAPFGKHLFSSDAFGLAELYVVAASLLNRGLRRVLDGWVGAGDCTASDADHIYAAISADNARRIYPLRPAQ